jgi:hypothetical protein
MRENGDSDDIAALNLIVKIDAHLQTVRWEIFSTPEYKGGTPGPTDYVSLVAEAEIPGRDNLFKSRQSGEIWMAPEVSRAWMKKENLFFLEKYKNKKIDVSVVKNCWIISAKYLKKNTTVEGLICKTSSNYIIYMILEDYT